MRNKAQTFVEYTLLIGIITSVLVVMSPMIRRIVQSFVKGVADQVGDQAGAEQDGGESGYLINSYTTARIDSTKIVQEQLYETTYNFISEIKDSQSFVFSNLGYSEVNQ